MTLPQSLAAALLVAFLAAPLPAAAQQFNAKKADKSEGGAGVVKPKAGEKPSDKAPTVRGEGGGQKASGGIRPKEGKDKPANPGIKAGKKSDAPSGSGGVRADKKPAKKPEKKKPLKMPSLPKELPELPDSIRHPDRAKQPN